MQRLRGALVEVAVDIPHAANDAIGHAITGAAVAPDRGEGITVVPIGAFPNHQQASLTHNGDMHDFARAQRKGGALVFEVGPVPFRPFIEQLAMELPALHHGHRW